LLDIGRRAGFWGFSRIRWLDEAAHDQLISEATAVTGTAVLPVLAVRLGPGAV